MPNLVTLRQTHFTLSAAKLISFTLSQKLTLVISLNVSWCNAVSPPLSKLCLQKENSDFKSRSQKVQVYASKLRWYFCLVLLYLNFSSKCLALLYMSRTHSYEKKYSNSRPLIVLLLTEPKSVPNTTNVLLINLISTIF